MNKRIMSAIAGLVLTIGVSQAMPAHPGIGSVTQPDGTTLKVRLHGDEFMHFTTTEDGYAIVRDADGYYRYAEGEGTLVAGPVTAHDVAARSASEKDYLDGLGKLRPTVRNAAQEEMWQIRHSEEFTSPKAANYDYRNFYGLVILVQYSDCKFTMADPLKRFGDMVTQKDYSGFVPDGGGSKENYTGSVADYFYDNSSGQFLPKFDVVGPVTVSRSQYYVESTTNIRTIIKEVTDMLDPEVDFSKYDRDGDGTVDMFYLIFAGGGANFSGNDSRLLWPHASSMPGNMYDGVRLGRYACSTELYGPPMWKVNDGIGTICHEFSHVLGLMDEYDTDYSGSGGQSDHPGDWSLMASGGYLNQARTPTGYSLMQRYQSGFCVPQKITADGEYSLSDIEASNHGYRIDTSDPREYFLLENKRKDSKWNKYNAGSGMLVHRVDSTSTRVWSENKINADPSHCYYLLLRAVRKGNAQGAFDHAGDPFPGTYGITRIDYDTDPALLAWSGKGAHFVISDIAESEDGKVTFKATAKKLEELKEDFENMTTESQYDDDVKGNYCTWSFYKTDVREPESRWCNGKKAAAMLKGGYMESSQVPGNTMAVSVTVSNATIRPVTFNVRCNTGGNNWEYLYEPGGLAGISLASKASQTYRFDVPADYRDDLKIQIRMANNSGDNTTPVYIDDVTMIQNNSSGLGLSEIPSMPGDGMNVNIIGQMVEVTGAQGPLALYDIAGRILDRAVPLEGAATLRLPGAGFFILSDGVTARRIVK